MTTAVNHGQIHYPSDYIRTKVNDFCQKTQSFVQQFFASETTSSHTTVHHHYHSYSPFYSPFYYSSPWWYEPSIVIGDRGRGRNNNDDGAQIVLSIIATIGALVASYAIGVAWSSLNEANEELDQTKEFENNLWRYQQNAKPEDQVMLAEAREAASLKERICARIVSSSGWDLCLRVSTAAGLALTAVSAALMPVAASTLGVGLVVTVVSLAAMLFKWGSDSRDSANIRDAEALRYTLNSLQKI